MSPDDRVWCACGQPSNAHDWYYCTEPHGAFTPALPDCPCGADDWALATDGYIVCRDCGYPTRWPAIDAPAPAP